MGGTTMDIHHARSATLACMALALATVTTIGVLLDALFSTGIVA
jgi:hypothetical protein